MIRSTLLVLFLALALLGTAFASSTPAGTHIDAQASASYVDSANQARTTTSNLVVTIVQQVYGVAVTPQGTVTSPGQSRVALAGGSADVAYSVRNTGNGTDTVDLSAVLDTDSEFTPSLSIYLDANCNGRIDAGEATASSTTLAMDAVACVVVHVAVPTDAATGQQASVELQVVSQADASAASSEAWASIGVTDQAVFSSSLQVSPSGSVAQGATLTYTLSGSNIGGNAAYAATAPAGLGSNGVLVEVDVPATLVLDPSSVSFAAGSGSGTPVYFTGGAWTTTAPAAPVHVDKVGVLLSGSDAFFAQGSGYSLSFQASVPGDAGTAAGAGTVAAGTSYLATGHVLYAATAGGSTLTTDSNDVTSRVAVATYLQAGPYQLATGSYSFAGATIARADGSQTIAAAYAGNTVAFRNTVANLGNAADSYTLSLTAVPSGWTCQTYAADGVTPLATLGPVPAGSSADVVLRCTVPADAVTAETSTITLTATSLTDATVHASTDDIVGSVAAGYGASLTVADPALASAQPGGTASFDLTLTNDGQNADSFLLTASANAFGSGSDVLFFLHAGDCSTPAEGVSSTSTGPLAPGASLCITARVGVPASATSSFEYGGARALTFTATSNGLASIGASASASVQVAHVGGGSFTPNRSGTVASPGTIDFEHVLLNSGNTTASIDIAAASGVCTGCTVRYRVDSGAFADQVSELALAPGASATVTVRLSVPSGEPVGRSLTVAPEATVGYLAATGSTPLDLGVTDTVAIVGGELHLTLTARTCSDASCTSVLDGSGATARPGDTLAYTTTASNLGTAPLPQVVLTDPLPAFTDYVGASSSASFAGTPLYSINGTTWSSTPPTSLAAGQSLYVAIDENASGTITSADTIPVGGTITVTLTATVR